MGVEREEGEKESGEGRIEIISNFPSTYPLFPFATP